MFLFTSKLFFIKLASTFVTLKRKKKKILYLSSLGNLEKKFSNFRKH